MGNNLQGLLYIILGAFIAFLGAGKLIIRVGFLILGIYLIYKGLELRNNQQVVFYFHRFIDKFNNF